MNGNISLAAPPVPRAVPFLRTRSWPSARTPHSPSQVSLRSEGSGHLLYPGLSPSAGPSTSLCVSAELCWGFCQRLEPLCFGPLASTCSPCWVPRFSVGPATAVHAPLLPSPLLPHPQMSASSEGRTGAPGDCLRAGRDREVGSVKASLQDRKTEVLGGRGFPFSAPRLLPVGSSALLRVLGPAQDEVPLVLPPPAELSVRGPHSRAPRTAAAPVARLAAEGALDFPSVFASALPILGRGLPQRAGLGLRQKKVIIRLPALGVPQPPGQVGQVPPVCVW